MENTVYQDIADTDNDLGDYLYFGGHKIPLRYNLSPLSPELCRALGVDEADVREACASMQVHISYTPLSIRALNSLMRGGIQTVEDVNAKTDKELLALRNFGKGCLAEVHRLFPDRVRVRKVKKPLREQDAERLADIIQMRRDRYTMREIAIKHGISKQRIYQILQEAGVETRFRVAAVDTEPGEAGSA